MDARKFLESLKDRVPAEQLIGERSKITFDLSGDLGGQFTLIIQEEGLWVEEGLHDDAPCGLRSDHETFLRIVNKIFVKNDFHFLKKKVKKKQKQTKRKC